MIDEQVGNRIVTYITEENTLFMLIEYFFVLYQKSADVGQ